MTIVAEQFQFVTGVDTHAQRHQFALMNAKGQLLEERSYPASPAGIARAVSWVSTRTGGAAMLASIDGLGSYGRLLGDAFTGMGVPIVQAPTVRYRPAGKDDRIDARLAATSVLPLDEAELIRPKTGIERDALQILLTARDAMNRERTAAINALTALLRRYDLGVDARRSLSISTIHHITRWRPRPSDALDVRTARTEAVRLARSIDTLATALATNATELREIITVAAPVLLAQPGIGPINAATIYTAWSHPGRVRSEAAFARLAGVAPKPVSSGNRERQRLDRGGNRHLNSAIHLIVLTRWRYDPDTQTYAARRRTEGRTDRDIRRALKRIVARQVYRLLQAN
ncbi:transposase [Microbacterium sp.]|uniref:transposase n=1 Tax=Microbacterium sp. TaxID=51671 RepID=UPI003F997184